MLSVLKDHELFKWIKLTWSGFLGPLGWIKRFLKHACVEKSSGLVLHLSVITVFFELVVFGMICVVTFVLKIKLPLEYENSIQVKNI